uniref:GT-4 protein n=1 Tax=Fopius arisanus TaxID=64838 RepID=A0A0C9S2G8_9HYME
MAKRSRLTNVSNNFLNVEVKDEIADDPDLIHEEYPVGVEESSLQHGTTSSTGCCINLWTPEATRCLIKLYKKYINGVGRPPMKSLKDMFEKISCELRILGHDYSTQKAENKWRVLERKYKRHKSMMEKTSGRIPTKLRRSLYFEHKEELDDIFGPIARVTKPLTDDNPETTENIEKVTQAEDNASLGSQMDDKSSGDLNSKIIQKALDRLTSRLGTYFTQMERNNERRHEEMTAIRLNELEIQRQMLEVRREELHLRKQQLNLSKDGDVNAEESILS